MVRGFRFEALTEKGRGALKDSVLLRKGASKWEKKQFKIMWKVELVSVDPYILDVISKSKSLARKIQPDVFLGVFKEELYNEHSVVIDKDFEVEVLK